MEAIPVESEPDDQHHYETCEVREIPRILWALGPDDFIPKPPKPINFDWQVPAAASYFKRPPTL